MISQTIFKANDIRGIVGGPEAEWDTDGAEAIGIAAAAALGLGQGSTIVIGRDMRVTGPEISAAFARGIRRQGVDVIDIGLASTDQLWYASGRLDLPGAMFTASHNPGHYNGIKFCFAGARPVTSDTLRQIASQSPALQSTEDQRPPAANRPGSLTEQDVLAGYAEHLHALVDVAGIRRLRVVVDAGNGMAGHTLPAVLGPLNLEIIGLYTDPDGTFPNHEPNPLEPHNLLDAQAAVAEHAADLALVFDGDADRCFIIDERSQVVSPSAITAMIASQELAREPGATIVCNTITSRAVPELVGDLGGKIVTTRVGHTFVKAAMAEHNAVFGGEHSAHYYFRDFWGADTGMLAALHVLAILGRGTQPLSEVVRDFARYVESGEINSRVADAQAAMDAVAERFAGQGQQDWIDGLTVSTQDWRFNVRPSNTEPLLRLNVEAAAQSMTDQLRDDVLAVIRAAGPEPTR